MSLSAAIPPAAPALRRRSSASTPAARRGPARELIALESEFLRRVAVRYFTVCAEAIRTHHPNHAILGCRCNANAARQERAGHFDDYVTALLSLPCVISFHWFQYADQPPQGWTDGENSNYGLVDNDDEPWQVLTARMRQVNGRLEAVHGERLGEPRPGPSAGDCARARCQVYLPAAEYFERTTEYCRMILDRTDPRPDGAIIHVPSHGEPEMAARIEESGQRLGVRARLVGDIVSHRRLTEGDYRDPSLCSLVREGIEGDHFQHCGFFDYSVAWALGHLDKPRLDILRHELERDLEGALRRYPVIHNLAGYVRYGGPAFRGLRLGQRDRT